MDKASLRVTLRRSLSGRGAGLGLAVLGTGLLGSCSEETAGPSAADTASNTQVDTGQASATAAGSAPESFPLLPDASGWVGPESNALGIQGAWSTRVGTGSSITLSFDGSSVCFSGEAAQIPMGGNGAEYFGAAATLDFCRPDPALPAAQGAALNGCASAPGLAQKLVGVGFSVDGTLPAVLRAGFRETDRMDTPFVLVREVGPVVALFADALVRNNPMAELSHPAQVQSVELLIPAARQAARPFNFCVRDLAALTGSGWVSKEIPEWALEPGPGKRVELAGVNLAGAEFGQQNLPGTYPADYQYPTDSEIDFYAEAGMNLIRLPFRWERLQQSLGQELDPTELERLRATVSYATETRGLTLLLDPHNYARYTIAGVEGIVGVDVDVAAFADFWRRLALEFSSNPKVMFGLVNEPHTMASETWLSAANAAIAAIREAGAQNRILVPGNGWSGAHGWFQSYYGTPNASVMGGVVDPGNNFVYELHQYLDSDSSGTLPTCVSETIGAARMQQVTDWLRQRGARGLLAEFGAPGNRLCLKAMDELLDYVAQNTDVWLGWAAWAGGPRWGDNLLSVEPLANGKDRPQLVVIRRHLADGTVSLAPPAP
jgi:endoglucanase